MTDSAKNWISVKDRLPEMDQFTLIYWGGIAPQVACYKGDNKWLGSDTDFWIAGDEVTHWYEWPELPIPSKI
jgi:hypothetical protein